MPFSVSHAGFVLPLRGILPAHVLYGLMIGSVVPDVGYFVRQFHLASFAHTVAGAVSISLPAGLVVYVLLRLSFSRLVNLLPKPHSSFLLSWEVGKPLAKGNLAGVAIAILAGALAHNFVDSFTHQSGVAVAMFPALSREALRIDGQPLHVFRLLQYFGSALGMAMILAAYWSGLKKHCHQAACPIWQDSPRWWFLTKLVAATILLATALNAKYFPRELDFYAFRVFGFKFLITWLPILGLAILACAAWRRPVASQ